MSERPERDPPSTRRDRLVGVAALEFLLLCIALVMPVTPSKTGSDWSFAHLFWPDPSYLQQVAVGFVVGHILLAVIALVAWVAYKLGWLGE